MAAKKKKKKPAPKKKKKVSSSSSARGPALNEAIVAELAKEVGRPIPLSDAQIAAVENAAGVALSPSMYAMLSFDAGWAKRTLGWFDDSMKLRARPTMEIIAEHAGAFAGIYEPLVEARLPALALPLDQGSDSMRFLYLGDPDALGEYPVFFIDHDDTPLLGIEWPGIDVALASSFDLATHSTKANEKRCMELLGVTMWDCQEHFDTTEWPAPVPGPAPGSIERAQPASAAVGAKKKKSAPPNKKLTAKQRTKALAEAAEDGDAEEVRALVSDSEATQKDLDAAIVATRDAATMRVLLAAGASPKARDYYGCILARIVHHDNCLELATILLDAGADPNGPSVNGETALHAAVEHASKEVVKLLLERGADPKRMESAGMTPIHTAVQRHPSGSIPDPSIVDLLIDHGGDPNGGKNHSSPLHWALQDGMTEHAIRLLERGADPNGPSEFEGRSPLHSAYSVGRDDLMVALIKAGADRTAKDAIGISFERMFDEKGNDIRPIDIHYVASKEHQRVTIEVEFAILASMHVANAALQLRGAMYEELGTHGLAGGDRFDPKDTAIGFVEDFDFRQVKGGFRKATMVLDVAGVAPEFFRLVAMRLFGGASTFTGAGVQATLRGVALSIRGAIEGKSDVDGATLRTWIRDPSVQLRAHADAFPIDVEEGVESAVKVVTEDGEPHLEEIHACLSAWLGLSSMWQVKPNTLGFLMAGVPTKKSAGAFVLFGMDPSGSKQSRRFPFEGQPPVDALRNAMRRLDARIPLAGVTLVRGA